jgi:hypothetical protein
MFPDDQPQGAHTTTTADTTTIPAKFLRAFPAHGKT